MKKLKHVQTSTLPEFEFYLIAKDKLAYLDSWNFFTTLDSAEEYLLENFVPTKGVEYSIFRITKNTLLLTYK